MRLFLHFGTDYFGTPREHGQVMTATGRRLLGIYVDDHVALLVGGGELVRRSLRGAADPALRAFLETLLPELRDDQEAATRVACSVGRTPSRLKQRLVRLAEKGGRLKLNGALTSRSPLSNLVELEGIAAILGLSRARWRALEHAGPEAVRADAGRRASRADERLAGLEELRLRVAEAVLAAEYASGGAGEMREHGSDGRFSSRGGE